MSTPDAIAKRYRAQGHTETAAEIEKAPRVLVWRSLSGMRGRFQWEAAAIPADMEPRDLWATISKEPTAYDRPRLFTGTLGPFAL
jgi:hypothetical protein